MQTFDLLKANKTQRKAAIDRAIQDFADANNLHISEAKKIADGWALGYFSTPTLARWLVLVTATLNGVPVSQHFDIWQQGRYPVAILEELAKDAA